MSEEKKTIEKILSSAGTIKGNCLGCGKPFFKLYKKMPRKNDRKNAFCSNSCYLNDKKYRAKKKQYEVFKDKKYYYIKVNGIFNTKRSLSGQVNYTLKEKIHPLDSDSKILSPYETIPEKAIKIIDRKSRFLYEKEYRFSNWKKLKEIITDRQEKV